MTGLLITGLPWKVLLYIMMLVERLEGYTEKKWGISPTSKTADITLA